MGHETSTLPHIGDLIDGRYRIDRILGEGGTSTVYQVSHIITDKKFAIKWLLPELALDEAAVDRFIQEARVGGRFSHPYAVQVYDICKANDSFYMLMEFLEGESLQARLERVGRLPVAAACAIALICTEVLRAAHQAGIIHRDLKPANIFLCAATDLRGEIPKLLDFGISTFCAGLQHAAGSSSVIGTPLYMAPEQMLGEPADPRTDIYALGAVLYELVSGRPPFHADNYAALVAQVTGDAQPVPLAQRAPDVDPAFAAIIAKAMAREPAARFASMSELAQALSRFAAEKGISSALRPSTGVATPQLPPRSSGEAGAHASASQRVKPVDTAASADAESEWRAELAPIRTAKLRRSVALALSLGALGVMLAMASGLREDRVQHAAGVVSPAVPNAFEQDAPAAPEDAPEPALARWELPAEPYAFAEERPNAPLAAGRPAARAAGVSRHKPEAANAAKSPDAASARKPVASGRAHVDETASQSHASAAPSATPSLATASSGSASALSSASGTSRASTTAASSLHVNTSPGPRAPVIRMSRSDFGGESAPGARMPAAAVSRQDF